MSALPMPAIPPDLLDPFARGPGFAEHAAPHFLKSIADYCGEGNQANTWGYTIFRTTYTAESETQFQPAVARLEEYMRHSVRLMFGTETTPQSSLEQVRSQLLERFHCDVVEDRSLLANASLDVVANIFGDWVTANYTPAVNTKQPGEYGYGRSLYTANPRYHVCLVVDQPSLDELAQLPPADTPGKFTGFFHRCKALRLGSVPAVGEAVHFSWFFAVPRLLFKSWSDMVDPYIDSLELDQDENDPQAKTMVRSCAAPEKRYRYFLQFQYRIKEDRKSLHFMQCSPRCNDE